MTIEKLRKLIRESINELTPNMASKVLDKRYSDNRAERIHPEAVKMVFREFIGKNFPWMMKVRNENQHHKYQLIDVRWRQRQEMNGDYIIQFDFHTNGLDNNVGADAPYSDYKQQFTLTYNINEDEILHDQNSHAIAYVYNRAFINALITFLNLSRKIFNKLINTRDKLVANKYIDLPGGGTIMPGEEIPKQHINRFMGSPLVSHEKEELPITPTRYGVGSFKIFDYSSNDIKH